MNYIRHPWHMKGNLCQGRSNKKIQLQESSCFWLRLFKNSTMKYDANNNHDGQGLQLKTRMQNPRLIL